MKVPLAAARGAPIPAGARSAQLMQRGSLSIRFYAPRGRDTQVPHEQDEVYIVVSGAGVFVREGSRTQFETGDLLFAAAGEEHRFEEFTDDFAAWVIFYGPRGGETPEIGERG